MTKMKQDLERLKKENDYLNTKLKVYKVSSQDIQKCTIETKEVLESNDKSLVSLFNGTFGLPSLNTNNNIPSNIPSIPAIYTLDLRDKMKYSDIKTNNSIKYIEKFSSLVLFRHYVRILDLINLQSNEVLKFPNPEINSIINDWFILKKYNMICLITSKSLLFYNIIDGSALCEIKISLKSSLKIIYNENLSSVVFIYKNVIKVYKLYINEMGVAIQLLTTHYIQYFIGCYLKTDHSFLTIYDTNLKIINLDSIDDGTNVVFKRDLSFKFYSLSNINTNLYFKENTSFVVAQLKDIIFLNYKTGDFYKIVKNADNITTLKKAKFNGKRHMLSLDIGLVIKVWDIYDQSIIYSFNTVTKIEKLEFSNLNEVIIGLDTNFTIKGWKLTLPYKK